MNTYNKLHTTRIVVLGAGFGGVYAFRRLHKHFHKRKDVELLMVSDSNFFLFTPLLHEVAGGNIDPVIAVEPLRKVLGCSHVSCRVDFHLGTVQHINTKEKKIQTDSGFISYDHVIIALGSIPSFGGVEGARDHTFTLKSMSDAIRLKNHIIGSVEYASSLAQCENTEKDPDIEAYIDELLTFVIVGGGPTGVELCAEVADLCFGTFGHYYPKELIDRLNITLIQGGGDLMPQFDPVIREKTLETLKKKSVRVLLGARVQKVSERSISLDNGKDIFTRSVIWTAGVKPVQVSFDVDIEREHGKIIVDDHLRIPNVSHVYALGDIAHFSSSKIDGLPALAQTATKQGDYLGDLLAHTINGDRTNYPFSFHKQGMLVSLGKWNATGEVYGVKLYGKFAWWLWRTIYLSKIISWTKKIKVAVDWTLNIFARRDISQISAYPNEVAEHYRRNKT